MYQVFSAADHRDLAALYGRLAPDYDKLHRRWLTHAGGETQAALEASVRAIATPDTNLLDAGSGTGAFARALISEGMLPACVTLLDPSEAMLARCADIPVRKVNVRLEALPFEDGKFDIVTCAWALETVPRPDVALGELCRVVRRGGVLCITFCAETPARALANWLMRQAIRWRGTGRFLSREQVVRTLKRSGEFEVRLVPSRGPAATLIARRVKLAPAIPPIDKSLLHVSTGSFCDLSAQAGRVCPLGGSGHSGFPLVFMCRRPSSGIQGATRSTIARIRCSLTGPAFRSACRRSPLDRYQPRQGC